MSPGSCRRLEHPFQFGQVIDRRQAINAAADPRVDTRPRRFFQDCGQSAQARGQGQAKRRSEVASVELCAPRREILRALPESAQDGEI